MKNVIFTLVSISLILIQFSCTDKIEETYLVNSPEYLSYDDLRASFKVKGGQNIQHPGKIYFKDDFIFVNEYQKGIHIINNTNPSQPQIVSFIEIPGNVDMAIKGNMLYADSYIDLLTIDISNMENVIEVDRDEDVFPYIIPEYESGLVDEIDVNRGVIVGYSVSEKTEEIVGDRNYYQRFPIWESEFFSLDMASANQVSGTGVGTGGSMARFTLYSDFLYAIDNASLHLFDVSDASDPTFTKQIPISWQIETLFSYEQMLFIGAQSGMYTYSLQNPANPQFISEFRHASACDPVVVEGDYAYVTLRGGNLCGAIESQLDVIDISTIESPQLVKSYPMTEPYGLGIENDVLFICDGKDGLKIYDADDPMAIGDNLIAHYKNMNAFDAIPLGNVLLVIGVDGLYQYDYSSLDNIQQLSYLPVYGD